jgi:plastocyanin
MSRRLALAALALAALLAVALAFGACGEGEDPDDVEASDTWTVTSRGFSFDTGTIVVPEGSEVVLHFLNEHRGYPHNISIYPEDGGDPVFRGEIIEGTGEVEYRFDAPEPGVYRFQCDPHPDRMRGTFVVRAADDVAAD